MATSMFAVPHQGPGDIAGINVTPLGDVMLVLLVIFMVTMPIRSQAISLGLPQAGSPPAAESEPVQVHIQADGGVLLDGVRVELAVLPAELDALHAQAPKAALVLESSDDAEYRAFAQALTAARNAGFRDIAISR